MTDSSVTEAETTAVIGEAAGTCENTLNNRDHPPGDKTGSCRGGTQTPSQPALSYVALIATVLLSSPSKELNLGSIYRALEKQFPFLRSRGPGWRNSVRHSLSVNECFVKVSRCQDGRGHYWGVHEAYLKSFQNGNFRQHRSPRARRDRVRRDGTAKRPAWMETTFFFRSDSSAWVDPQRFLAKPLSQTGCLDQTNSCCHPRSFTVTCVPSPTWMRHCCPPKRRADSSRVDLVERGHGGRPLTSAPPCWMISGLTESHDCRLPSSVQPLRFHCCWCTSPPQDFINPSSYRENLNQFLNQEPGLFLYCAAALR